MALTGFLTDLIDVVSSMKAALLLTSSVFLNVLEQKICAGEDGVEQKTFTVEDAVETIGFGRFHIALFMIMGSTGVSFYWQKQLSEAKNDHLL